MYLLPTKWLRKTALIYRSCELSNFFSLILRKLKPNLTWADNKIIQLGKESTEERHKKIINHQKNQIKAK